MCGRVAEQLSQSITVGGRGAAEELRENGESGTGYWGCAGEDLNMTWTMV